MMSNRGCNHGYQKMMSSFFQDAPELNEENFPSLGSCGSSKSQQPSPKKADFAAAVRTPSSAPQTPHSLDKKASPLSPAPATPKGQKQPWAETGLNLHLALVSSPSSFVCWG